VIIETGIDQDFKMTPGQLASAITDKTRLVVLNSPSNPTGASYTGAELAALGAVIESHPNVVVVADDMYEHIYWAPDPFTSFATACPALFDRTVTTNGVSKAYAMTGWRIGYAGGPVALIEAMATVQSQSTSNASSISQAAALAALDGEQAIVREMCEAYARRHDYVVGALKEIDGVDCRPGEGTFYAFPRVAGCLERLRLADDVALAELLLNEADVACVPGSAFGAPGYLRMSFATARDQLEEAMNRISRVLSA
jgi:aspartate aminotransferase